MLVKSDYPYRHRLIAQRLLAGTTSLSDPEFQLSATCKELILFCQEILNASRDDDYDKRTYGQLGDKGLAIETLCSIASQESLNELVTFIIREKSDVQALKKAIGEVERLAARRFIHGYQWESDWGGRALFTGGLSGVVGVCLGGGLAVMAIGPDSPKWLAWFTILRFVLLFPLSMFVGSYWELFSGVGSSGKC
jgi:hypothetical protein